MVFRNLTLAAHISGTRYRTSMAMKQNSDILIEVEMTLIKKASVSAVNRGRGVTNEKVSAFSRGCH